MSSLNFQNGNNPLFLHLTDLSKTYEYPRKDFCRVRHFPPTNYVLVVINTKEALECTCTIAWLIQWRTSLIIDPFVNTSSIYKCIQYDEIAFQTLITGDCKRLYLACDEESTQTSSELTSEEISITQISTINEEETTMVTTTTTSSTTSIINSTPQTTTTSTQYLTTNEDTNNDNNKDGLILALSISLGIISFLLVVFFGLAVYFYVNWLKLKRYKSDISYEITTFDRHIKSEE